MSSSRLAARSSSPSSWRRSRRRNLRSLVGSRSETSPSDIPIASRSTSVAVRMSTSKPPSSSRVASSTRFSLNAIRPIGTATGRVFGELDRGLLLPAGPARWQREQSVANLEQALGFARVQDLWRELLAGLAALADRLGEVRGGKTPVHQDLLGPVLGLVHRDDFGREVLVDDEVVHLLVVAGDRGEGGVDRAPPALEGVVAGGRQRRVGGLGQGVAVVGDVRQHGCQRVARGGGPGGRGGRDQAVLDEDSLCDLGVHRQRG